VEKNLASTVKISDICVSNFNALEGFKRLESICMRSQKATVIACSVFSLSIADDALCGEVLDVHVAFSLFCMEDS